MFFFDLITLSSIISLEQQGLFTTFTSVNVVSGAGEGIIAIIEEWNLLVDLLMKVVILLSYNRGLITELMGKMTIENKAYQGVASITLRLWRQQTITNGIQQKKSVAIMVEIFRCICNSALFFFFLLPFVSSLEDLVVMKLMKK